MQLPRITVKRVVVPLLAWGFILAVPVHSEAPAVNQPSGQINHYETVCQKAVREGHGVPWQNEAHAQWQRDHFNTPEGIAYNEAVARCPKPKKFDFENMILVGTE